MMSRVTKIRIILLSAILGSFMMVQALEAAADAPRDFSSVVEPLIPSVVNISTTTELKRDRQSFGIPRFPQGSQLEELFRQFFEGQDLDMPRKATSLGSGFVIAQEGNEAFIVTCNHVIDDADKIRVTFHDKMELTATVVGRDKRTDVALLKVKTSKKLSVVEWGESKDVKVGQWLLAIGNPFGLSSTVTVGIVSTIARDIASRARGLSADYVEGYIQTDASINMGNSGGPQFDAHGKVIGISTAIFSPNGGNIGIGFGIPADIARTVVDQLRKYGRTKRGLLGVKVQVVTEEIAQSIGLGKARGAMVAEVTPKGPAAKVGVKSGDIILKFNNVEVQESRQLPRIVGESPIAKKVPMLIWRNGKEISLDVVVGEYEQAESESAASEKAAGEELPEIHKHKRILGMEIVNLTPEISRDYQLSDDIKSGILIARVDRDSEAAEKGLQEGDVITEIRFKNDVITPTTSNQVEEFVNKVLKASPGPVTEGDEKPENKILLQIARGKTTRFVALKAIEANEDEDETDGKPSRRLLKRKRQDTRERVG